LASPSTVLSYRGHYATLSPRPFFPSLTSLSPCFPFLLPVLCPPQENQPTIRFVRIPICAGLQSYRLDGKPVTLADSHGRVILLEFLGHLVRTLPRRNSRPRRAPEQIQGPNSRFSASWWTMTIRTPSRNFPRNSASTIPSPLPPTTFACSTAASPPFPLLLFSTAEGRIVQKHEGLRDPVLYETEIRALLGLPIGNVKVETFEDTGQIFLKHAERATELPGVRSIQINAGAKNFRASQIQRRNLQLRLHLHARAMPHLRP